MSERYKFPNGCSQYGAHMGRADNITERDYPVKFACLKSPSIPADMTTAAHIGATVPAYSMRSATARMKGKNTSAGLWIGTKRNSTSFPTSRMPHFTGNGRPRNENQERHDNL